MRQLKGDNFVCELCEWFTCREGQFLNHITMQHCMKMLTNRNIVKDHNGRELYSCALCTHVFNTVQDYLDHVGKDQHCSQSLGFYIVMEYNVYKCNAEVAFIEKLSPKSFKPWVYSSQAYSCSVCNKIYYFQMDQMDRYPRLRQIKVGKNHLFTTITDKRGEVVARWREWVVDQDEVQTDSTPMSFDTLATFSGFSKTTIPTYPTPLTTTAHKKERKANSLFLPNMRKQMKTGFRNYFQFSSDLAEKESFRQRLEKHIGKETLTMAGHSGQCNRYR